MRITFVNPFFYPYRGGIENYMLDLGKYLVKRGHEVSVIASRFDNEPLEEDVSGIRVHKLKSIVFKNLPAFLPPPFTVPYNFFIPALKIMKKEKPDLIHVHNRFFPSFYSVILVKKLLGKPLFLTIHNARPKGINFPTDFFGAAYDNFIGNILMRSCDFIIGNSQYSLDVTLPRDFPRENTGVAYNGICTSEWERSKNKSSDFGVDELLLADARLVPQKGLEYLLKALPLLEFSYHLIIKGRGPEKKNLEKLALSLGVEDKVSFHEEFITTEELIGMYSEADQFVFPSLYEPFGIALLQAMSMSLPVTASNVGGIPEVLGDAGALVPPRDKRAIAENITLYHDDKKLARRKAKEARKRAVDLFDWRVVGRRVEEYYEEFV